MCRTPWSPPAPPSCPARTCSRARRGGCGTVHACQAANPRGMHVHVHVASSRRPAPPPHPMHAPVDLGHATVHGERRVDRRPVHRLGALGAQRGGGVRRGRGGEGREVGQVLRQLLSDLLADRARAHLRVQVQVRVRARPKFGVGAGIRVRVGVRVRVPPPSCQRRSTQAPRCARPPRSAACRAAPGRAYTVSIQ